MSILPKAVSMLFCRFNLICPRIVFLRDFANLLFFCGKQMVVGVLQKSQTLPFSVRHDY